ncbi:Uncharacterised protein [Vibrio cholerae]|uniref:Uncharacterized protein n=1 Tax=Vibrio cholerae TaxID=666 RepID=A0A655QVC7_VIBCL|nr:Uncharacterised protein [Vibrio cholerae]CSA74317.1 Uncharacterised protein [Vibrio cholerae]CSI62882.1 Uncharacterised protein [Vibrio cholerae]
MTVDANITADHAAISNDFGHNFTGQRVGNRKRNPVSFEIGGLLKRGGIDADQFTLGIDQCTT